MTETEDRNYIVVWDYDYIWILDGVRIIIGTYTNHF